MNVPPQPYRGPDSQAAGAAPRWSLWRLWSTSSGSLPLWDRPNRQGAQDKVARMVVLRVG